MHYYNYVIIIISPHLNFIAPQNFSIHGGSYIVIIIIIIQTFVTRLLQLKNEHKRYICYIKIYKNR